MSNALAQINQFDLASLLPQDALANMMAAFNDVDESFSGGGVPTLSFKGREFHVKDGSNTYTLDSRKVDFYLVGIRPCDHVTFYDTDYDTVLKTGEPGKTLTRDMTADDPKTKDWVASDGWISRTRQRRCVVMLANDTEHKLLLADFGELSLYAPKDTKLGLFNLGQVIKQMAVFRQHNKAVMPFMFKLQMSFTSADSVPVVQFSFQDQVSRAEQIRAADPQAIQEIAKLWASGDVQRILDMWIDNEVHDGKQVEHETKPPAVTVEPQPQEPVWVPQDEAEIDEL